ncbi:MAG TPA: UDP-N-acetylmuramate dehydrogenase [Tenuifilaceae bacterium]|nr:UDP-N-acetylmuramate dehydrogenase [Tenuifilaceae bacterium]HPI45804.1 UDP-N-acetylmuramate dehydrogenase [Tenuifilaceae bacterium]HPN21481.1 UDP-N-acetylmuramate dehydrogenase [Tenuifilaceae bacterium]
MFVIKKNISLKRHNTFGIDVSTNYYAKANTVEKVLYAINFASYNKVPIYILGGGSNILLTKDFDGVIINPAIQGITLMEDMPEDVVLRAGAGVNWDTFVDYCVERGLGGVENLSNIPGNVGAAPIQNIGAYGVEAKDTIVKIEGIQIDSRKVVELNNSECRFDYRDSVFKQELKGKFVVTYVWFKLSKNAVLQTNYGNLDDELSRLGERTLRTVRQAVINIRTAKLPDPNIIGNAGSFFKNPIVEISQFNAIKLKYPNVPSYPVSESFVKIPAGWLIEQCGWKGKQVGNCGVHANQALVIVNYGNSTGAEILNFAQSIQKSVEQTFSVKLEMEVNVL